MAKHKSNDGPARKRYKSEGRALKNKKKKMAAHLSRLQGLKNRAVKLNKYTKIDKTIVEVQAKLDKLGK